MDSQIYGVPNFLFFTLFTFLAVATSALPESSTPAKPSTSGVQINSNSVLVALLDSHYTELSELVEKALLLQTLEEAVSKHNITIFAPRNEALERDLDPEFKRFLLEPGNLRSLQNLLLFHMIPTRIESKHWPVELNKKPVYHSSLCPDASDEKILLKEKNGEKIRLLIPKSVQQDFNARRSLRATSAVLPEGAPVVDPRTHRLKKPAPPVPVGAPLSCPFTTPWLRVHHWLRRRLPDPVVHTTTSTVRVRLVSEGYVLTVLAPNDEAMAKLTTDQLSEPGAPEQIMYYHLIPEYQTEESMYNSVRRFGKVKYDTLRLPHKVVAEEADGSVKFGQGEGSAYLFDPDIYTDGRISVQGIDGVLFPPEESKGAPTAAPVAKVVSKPRREFGRNLTVLSGGTILANFVVASEFAGDGDGDGDGFVGVNCRLASIQWCGGEGRSIFLRVGKHIKRAGGGGVWEAAGNGMHHAWVCWPGLSFL
ncbi:UNVERIFIED_CONTAM: Fasciclin-like arabinogalactan protein 17 [Sesamum angustifolium]|uniref:Fasciclin-like arabinogalactan protein 17 n=1 Tax=Sesamum angustifolium TaxID=2727405 RepID=A0AAW2N6K1_9LAMI